MFRMPDTCAGFAVLAHQNRPGLVFVFVDLHAGGAGAENLMPYNVSPLTRLLVDMRAGRRRMDCLSARFQSLLQH